MDNEVAREEGECREEAVDDEEAGGERVDADMHVRYALEDLELVGGEDGVVAREEDLDRSCGPTEHLMEAVGEVDGGRTAKGVTLGYAVDRAPSTVVHAVPCDHVLCH